ncbi:nucleoside-triphosphate phosphatase [Trifolium repens]|nr:nucleoside-triphosphate phosphatase [Trifolium repens]
MVFTGEVRLAGERVGFEVVTLDGRTCPLASSNFSSQESHRWPNVGKYKVDVASFESLALPELQVREDTDLFIIDKVGKMELYSSSFFPAVLKVLDSNIPILASIPVPKFGRDIPAVARLRNHAGATLFTLSVSNRDAVREQIHSFLEDLCIKHHRCKVCLLNSCYVEISLSSNYIVIGITICHESQPWANTHIS